MDASEWDARYASNESVWGVEPNQFVRAQMVASQLSPGRALDLGCGEGRNALWLAAQEWDVLGVDFSAAAIQKARVAAAHSELAAQFVVGDVLTHPIQPAAYDLVLIAYLQFELHARIRLLEQAEAALAPGGTLLLVAHDIANLELGFGGPQSPEVLWSVTDVTGHLDSLQVEVAEVVERHVDTDDGPRTALDTLVRARRHSGSQ